MVCGIAHLKRRSEFVRVAKDGRSAAALGLVLQALARSAEPGAAERMRLGITASRKVGNAVARNRARRRLREAARLILPSAAAERFDYVLIGRQATLVRPFTALCTDLAGALRRVGAVRPAAGLIPRAAKQDPGA